MRRYYLPLLLRPYLYIYSLKRRVVLLPLIIKRCCQYMKYNNKLYNFIPELSGINETTDTPYKLFIYKLIKNKPEYMDENIWNFLKQLIHELPQNQHTCLLYAIAISGGAFKPQFNYLGFIPPDSSSSKLRKLIYNINKTYGVHKQSVVFTETVNLQNEKSSFISITEEGLSITRQQLDKLSIIPAAPLLKRHSSNLEHAACLADMLYYIIGNNHYPCSYSIRTEDVLSEDNKLNSYIVSDAVCITALGLKDNAASTIDYIEFHTGSQHKKVIVEKILAYTKQLSINPRLSGEYMNDTIIFLIHPGSSCANAKSGRKCLGDASKNTSDNNSTLLSSSVLLNTCYLLQMNGCTPMQLYRLLGHTALKRYEGILYSTGCFKLNYEDIKAVHEALADAFSNDRMSDISDVSDNVKDTVISDVDIHTLISRLECNKKVQKDADQETDILYEKFFNTYKNIDKTILVSSINEFSKKYNKYYKIFKNMCLNGLSLSTCFGADMYTTYLFIHPFYTGAAETVFKILINAKLIAADSVFSINNLSASTGGNISLDDGSSVYLRNMCKYTYNNNALTGYVFMEYISHDIGGQIRISSLLEQAAFSGTSGARIICLVDSFDDAYLFLASKVKSLIKNEDGSLVSFTHLLPYISTYFPAFANMDAGEGMRNYMSKTDIIGLPVFITKEDVINLMLGNKFIGPFAFKDTAFYTYVFNEYFNHKDQLQTNFIKFFKAMLTKYPEEARKDILIFDYKNQ